MYSVRRRGFLLAGIRQHGSFTAQYMSQVLNNDPWSRDPYISRLSHTVPGNPH